MKDNLTTRKPRLETVISAMLADYPADTRFRIMAHELWADGEGGLSSNDRFQIARDVPRDDVPEICRGRWEVFKINYCPKARVSDLSDIGYDPAYGVNLECAGLSFVDIEPAA